MQAGERDTGEPDPRRMVHHSYYGCFVPVEAASFDVAITPEAIVELPLDREMSDRSSPRKGSGVAARRRRGGSGS